MLSMRLFRGDSLLSDDIKFFHRTCYVLNNVVTNFKRAQAYSVAYLKTFPSHTKMQRNILYNYSARARNRHVAHFLNEKGV